MLNGVESGRVESSAQNAQPDRMNISFTVDLRGILPIARVCIAYVPPTDPCKKRVNRKP